MPTFAEPWEARAFAIARALQDQGLFTPAEWSDALGAEIRRAQAAGDPDTGETYYRHWLCALETLVAEKNLASTQALASCRTAWACAAERTPHGLPIELRPDDFHD
ncbi:nitrile hydratase accessory protein [Mycolicibacterium moriokaense]|uniref:Nitrile hydratase accessory protein n=1 Tax=Mycolicibacterium moriokaense TaxID=39691 RepID=A0A318HI33_9MYCO|nr:nitrile hydratase accessory protein [Mycolicibacterium moriokaense]PXX09838.1 nitrile hydratase accessory protein [Mycolicibacterium moriokaense]